MIEKMIIKGMLYTRYVDVEDYQAMEFHTFLVCTMEKMLEFFEPYPSLISQETWLAGCCDPYLEIALYIFIH